MAGNVNANVDVVTSEILQGAGKITADGYDMGSFQGGVQVTVGQSELFVESDYSLGPVDSEVTNIEYTVSTELEMATLERLAVAWGMHSSSVASETSSKVLELIPEEVMLEQELVFEGMSATNRLLTRTFTLYRCVRIGSSNTPLARGVKTVVPVTWKCLQNTSKSFGSISDATISA